MALTKDQETRLKYLKKVRPNDPQVKKLEKLAKTGTKSGNIPDTNIGKVTSGPKEVNQALNTGLEAGQAAATASNLTANANVTNPFGSSTTTVDPKTGQATVTQNLSGEQQQILNQGQDLTQQGQQLASQNLGGYSQYKADTSGMGAYTAGQGAGQALDKSIQGYQPFSFQSDDAARQRIEQDTFNRLSRGMDQRHQQQSQDLEQSLYNRGIQFSNDPNSRYQQELKSMQQSQQDERQSYQQQAVTMGGQEMSRNYDMASGTYGNQLSGMNTMAGISQGQYGTNLTGNQARNSAMQGQQQQMMSDTAALQGMGTGLMVPNFQNFQGNAVDPSVGASTAATFAGMKGDEAVKKANARYLNSKASSGGGGGSRGSGSQPQVFY